MSLRRNITTGEIREISDEQIAAWLAAGNPKGEHYSTAWEPYTPPPSEPAPTRWRVKRDTVWNRLLAILGSDNLHAAFDAMPPRDYREFFANEYFWSDNQRLRAYLAVNDLDPDVVLAADEYI